MASAYFRTVLPSDLQRFVSDPGRMSLENVSLVSDELRGSQSDLLWRCQAPGRKVIYIYVLFEHQSEPHPLMPARLLYYLVKIFSIRVRRLGVRRGFCGSWWSFRRRICEALSRTLPMP